RLAAAAPTPPAETTTGGGMKLEGSCHCGAVRFSVSAPAPYPYMRCYCSICRKTAGGGGYAINLGADRRSLEVTGEEHLSVYRARLADGSLSGGERNFCRLCGSALWLFRSEERRGGNGVASRCSPGAADTT